MIIFHLSYFAGNCFLWGETPAENFPKRRGRPPKNPKPLSSPFDVCGVKLGQVLAAAGIGINKKAETTMTAWLPSLPNRPIASSLLVDQPPLADQELKIRPWKVTTLRLLSDEVISLLAACANRRHLAPKMVIGADIAFWGQGLRFAGFLAAGGRILPGVKQQSGVYTAIWEPVLAGDDMESLVALAKKMPASCYCLSSNSAVPDTHAPSAVLGFSAMLIDTLVREEAMSLQGKAKIRRDRTAAGASVHQRWLAALTSPSGLLQGDPAELVKLTYQIKEWRRRVYTLSAAPYRFCFRLEEPGIAGPDTGGNDIWTLRYLLQAKDDPSLLVSATDVWQGRVELKTNGQSIASLREFILTALGQAACFSPQIEESMKSGISAGATLDTSGAFEFLHGQAPLLRQAGFSVMLPSWWTSQGTAVRLSVTGRANSSPFSSAGGLDLGDAISFDWQVALGDEVLSFEELDALARLKSPLVKLRGQWVEVDTGEIKKALNFWRKKASQQLTARDVVNMTLGAAKQPAYLPLRKLSASGWLGDLLQRLQGEKPCPELPSPPGLRGQLRPYQLRGYAWLNFLSEIGFGACLADDMGLGKTIQCLALLQRRHQQGGLSPALLVCPTSVMANWEREAARFTPELPLYIHHGPSRKKGHAFVKAAKNHAAVITSYALLGREGDVFQKVCWDGVILDEAQNIKNPLTRQAKAACSLDAEYRIALTGTPVENNVGDLWSLMEFLNPGLLGNQAEFKRSFLTPIQVQQSQQAVHTLKRLTGPFILRRLKTDRSIIKDLPDKTENKVFCCLTEEQASLYAAIVKEVATDLDTSSGIERQGMILAALSKFKQVCNHPAQFLKDNSELAGRSGKIIRLTEMAEEILAAGQRALIFTQFASMGKLLHQYLMETFGYPVLFLHGGVAKKERDRMINLFQGEDGPPFFVLTIKAGGTGLNLTQANHVFHFDRWWNPAVENQATDRVYRIGQQKNVQVYKFVCQGTIEERIDNIIERKLELAENIVGSGESWLTKLTTAELKELMVLREEAIGDW